MKIQERESKLMAIAIGVVFCLLLLLGACAGVIDLRDELHDLGLDR